MENEIPMSMSVLVTDRADSPSCRPELEFNFPENLIKPQNTLRPPYNPLSYTFDPFFRSPNKTYTPQWSKTCEDIVTEVPAKYGYVINSPSHQAFESSIFFKKT